MKRLGLLLVAIFSLQIAFAAGFMNAGKEKVTGTYKTKIIGTPQGDFDVTLKVWEEEGKVKATMEGDGQKFEMENVKIEGAKLTMSMFAEGTDVEFDLKVEGDKISGYMMYDYEVKGERVKKQ